MKIWIDTTSGTWGEVDGDQGRLMIVDLDEAAARMVADPDHGVDDDFTGEGLLHDIEANDEGLVEFANDYGHLAS